MAISGVSWGGDEQHKIISKLNAEPVESPYRLGRHGQAVQRRVLETLRLGVDRVDDLLVAAEGVSKQVLRVVELVQVFAEAKRGAFRTSGRASSSLMTPAWAALHAQCSGVCPLVGLRALMSPPCASSTFTA